MQRGCAATGGQIEHPGLGVQTKQNTKSFSERQSAWMERLAQQQMRPVAGVQIGTARFRPLRRG
jgi:hypothetical protein